MTDLIPPDQIITTAGWSLEVVDGARGGQHVGTMRGVCVEHVPTGVKIVLPHARSQHTGRRIAVEALEFILTHPEWR